MLVSAGSGRYMLANVSDFRRRLCNSPANLELPEANGVILSKAVLILRLMNAKIPAWFA